MVSGGAIRTTFGPAEQSRSPASRARATTSAASWASLVGIDSVNIDDTRGGARPAHTTLLGAGVPVVEHLTGLDDVVGRSFRFYAVPAPIRGLGTFPVRAFAELE